MLGNEQLEFLICNRQKDLMDGINAFADLISNRGKKKGSASEPDHFFMLTAVLVEAFCVPMS